MSLRAREIDNHSKFAGVLFRHHTYGAKMKRLERDRVERPEETPEFDFFENSRVNCKRMLNSGKVILNDRRIRGRSYEPQVETKSKTMYQVCS